MANWTYPDLKIAATTAPYDTMSDVDCAAALDALTTPTPTDLSTAAIRNLLSYTPERAMGVIALIADGITSTVTANAASTVICRTMIDLLHNAETLPGIDPTGWANVQGMFGALEDAGVISNATNMLITAVQLPSVLNYDPPVSDGDVYAARNFF